MRSNIPFGYTPFGGVHLVKLNVKLFPAQCLELVQKYPGVIHWDNGKYGRAIEGTLKYTEVEAFMRDLNYLKIDYKIQMLIDQKTALLDAFTKQTDYFNELNNPLV